MNNEKKHNCECGHGEHKHEDGHACCGHGDHNHEEEHGCGCHSHEEVEMMYITLDDDKELACQVLAVFSIEDQENKEYIALLPEGEEDVYLYGYEETEEGPVLSMIEKDEEYEMVSEAFYTLCE